MAGMPKPLWAPWRLEYVAHADELPGCPLCAEAAGEVAESLVVHRGERVFALLNKFPYSSGHLILAPYAHVGGLVDLGEEGAVEVHRLTLQALAALQATYRPSGFNLGWNLGRAAGAGIPEHVHLHVVPRWAGDTSFMPVLGDAKVIPEHLLATRDRLRDAWSG
jgi:ATP adenylyltransferase